jgi:hypothetical protein
MRSANKPDGTPYYEYVLIYVDDILAISHDPNSIMDSLAKYYTLKTGSAKAPDKYLGAQIRTHTINPGLDPRSCWAMPCDKYVKRAVEEVQITLGETGQQLQTKVKTPVSQGYRPELDASPELSLRQTNYFQGLTEVLRWMIELGQIDIMVSVAMLSRFLAAPHEGNLNEVLHIFANLKEYDRSSLVFDYQALPINEKRFEPRDWSQFYRDATEAIPPNAPKPRGASVVVSCFVDADHAGCRVTQRSITGIIIYV